MAVKEEKIQYEYKTITYHRSDVDECLNKWLKENWEIEFMSTVRSDSGAIYVTYTIKRKVNGSQR